jgi:broad specificity phosphatase PhoE
MEPPVITRRRRPFLAPVWLTMLAVVVAIGIAIAIFRSATTTVVVLVGPAEKGAGTIEDPPLSPDGEQRAQQLAQMFGESRGALSALYVSQTRGAQQTAAPLADRLGLHPILVPANDPGGTASRVLAEHDGGTAMVIGTNANVAQLLQELSGRDVDTAKDDEYDTVFVISVPTFGDANVLRMKY